MRKHCGWCFIDVLIIHALALIGNPYSKAHSFAAVSVDVYLNKCAAQLLKNETNVYFEDEIVYRIVYTNYSFW